MNVRFFQKLSLCAHLVAAIIILGCSVPDRASAQAAAPSASPSPTDQPAAQAPAPSPSPSAVAQAPAAPVTEQPVSADDVSWLFPAPTKAADLAKLISMGDLMVANPQDPTKGTRVWSDAIFKQFLAIAASPAAAVGANRINLPPEAQKVEAWHIAGIRFDPGAPGLTGEVIAEYGQSPQIRLIVQPVRTESDGSVTPLDFTGHLIFGFAKTDTLPPAKDGCFPRPIPDLDTFKKVTADIAALRSKLRDGQMGDNKIATAGRPLGVHPGLTDQTTAANVRAGMKTILEKYLTPLRLRQMAVMGLPSDARGEPWIFLAMLFLGPPDHPDQGQFIPVPGPTLDGKQFAQLLQPAFANPRVVPTPHTNNQAPITCVNAALGAKAGPPIPQRKGVATADLPASPPSDAADKAKVLSELNTIADPAKSHFFNTDCVSCHTETRRLLELLQPGDIPKIDAAPLPNGPWNVRNFGWSPLTEGDADGTVSRRTAAETRAVVDFINANLLNK
jgi:hypothetical protein